MEKSAPMFALTRRIAFGLCDVKREAETFDHVFRPLDITEKQVSEWLKNRNWLLFIDELNNLDLLSKEANLQKENVEVAEFLKRHFLIKQGQYFVFLTAQ